MLLRAIDIETTGLEPGHAIVEIGWCDILLTEKWRHRAGPWNILINPERPIPPVSSAVHHITSDMVAGARTLAQVLEQEDIFSPDVTAYVAHNAKFEASFLPQAAPLICTYKLAITYSPQAPGHKLQELRYWLGLKVDPAIANESHRAGPDAYVCAALITRMLNKLGPKGLTIDEAIRISSNPVLLPFLTFGKHAMQPCAEIPTGYWSWCLKQDMDPDVKHTAFHYLNANR